MILGGLIGFLAKELSAKNKEQRADIKKKKENKKKLKQIKIHAPNLLKILAGFLKDDPGLYGFGFSYSMSNFWLYRLDNSKELYNEVNEPSTILNEIDILIDKDFIKIKDMKEYDRTYFFNDDLKGLIK